MPKKRVLVGDPIARAGIDRLRAADDVDVEVRTGLSKDDLIKIIADFDGLIVRSETKVTADVLNAGTRLKVVARAGVGVDNVDVDAATRNGVIVVNTPSGNTIAATEQAFLLLLATARKLPQAHISVKAGKWERKQFMGVELAGKTLGIVGLGRIGLEIARRALSFAMTVVAYDPFVTQSYIERQGLDIRLSSLDDVLSQSDFLTIHSPLTDETRHMISDDAFEMMKTGVRIVNAARGGVIDETALYNAVKSGKVAAAGLDVFEQEPVDPNSPLLSLDNVIVAPHLGASTEEAQVKVAVDAAESVIAALNGELVPNAVNLPGLSKEQLDMLRPYLRLAEKMGRLAVALSDAPIVKADVVCQGTNDPRHASLLATSVLTGLLASVGDNQSLNLVNARSVAEQKGLTLSESRTAREGEYSGLTITLNVTTTLDDNAPAPTSKEGLKLTALRRFEGTLVNGEARISRVNDFRVDVLPVGYLLVSRHIDQPGMIGKVGTKLGEHSINIAQMEVGRQVRSGEAVMIFSVDEPVPTDVVNEIAAIKGVENLRFVDLGA